MAAKGYEYPTALWAPVSKPFSYSILYFSDELVDEGKLLRKSLADFESIHNADKYSFTNYLGKIKAPVQIQHGKQDKAVPFGWSKELLEKLKNAKVRAELFLYENSNHHISSDWHAAVQKDYNFFSASGGDPGLPDHQIKLVQ